MKYAMPQHPFPACPGIYGELQGGRDELSLVPQRNSLRISRGKHGA
ncbi:MAG: hypothetical protein WBB70_11095 [Desulfobacterales bacterium]